MRATFLKLKTTGFYFITVILFIFSCNCVNAADLYINGQSNQIYENQDYDRLIIINSNDIIIRNCNFSSNLEDVVYISASSNITIENCDIDGLIDACSGVKVISNSSYINIINCSIHDIADDGMELVNSDHLYIAGNKIYRLYGVGTDGGGGTCFNGHSDGLEISGVSNSTFENNFVYDVRSTSGFYLANSATNSNILVKNNIFYTPESGFSAYAQNTNGVKFYNNTIWQGRYGGICIRDNVTDLEFYNNITHSINYNHFGFTQPSDHLIDFNIIGVSGQGYTANVNDKIDNAPFTVMAGIGGAADRTPNDIDFNIKGTSQAVNNGTTGADVPSTDYFGNSRSGIPDMGAIEYGSDSGSDTTPPLLSNIKAINITDNSALISWVSNEQADSQVEFGPTQSYGSSTILDTNLQTSHSMELADLSPNTLYHYRVKSSDASGNLAVSADYVFTTFDQGQVSEQFTISDVVASSDDGNIPENTIDNDLATRWSAEGDGEWIEYDLEAENRITQVRIAFHRGDQRTTQFDIQVSIDRTSWATVFSGTSSGSTLQQEEFNVQESSARYVRIVGHGNSVNNWNSITEVDIYGFAGAGNLTPQKNFKIIPFLDLLLK